MSTTQIALLTDARSSHSLYIPILDAIKESQEFDYQYVVTGMHLSERYGYTIDDIREQDYRVAHMFELSYDEDSPAAQADHIGACINNLTEIFTSDRPDVILAQGDRGCALAAAIVGAHMRIPVAHLFGGEVSGTIDESVRHAVTKLAHVHFVATEESGERIRKLGEDDFRIHVVGTTGIERIKDFVTEADDVLAEYGLNSTDPFIIVAQHPVSGEVSAAGEQMRKTLEAFLDTDLQALVIYPNSDPGNQKMIEVIDKYADHHGDQMTVQEHIPRPDYVALLDSAKCIVGNSSAGIVEAPSFGLPVINIGTRQAGRERAPNVIDTGYEASEIADALERALNDLEFREGLKRRENPYDPHGDAEVSARILDALRDIEPNRKLLDKKIVY